MGCRKNSSATSGRDQKRRLLRGRSACAAAATQTPREINMLATASGSDMMERHRQRQQRQVHQHVIFQAGAEHQSGGRLARR